MPSRLLPWLRRSIARRLTSALLLVSWALAVWPLPLTPVATTPKDRSRPFPCRDRACGCRSAEECWQGCCCFTDREKLAWAAANDVVAPDYVVAAAAQEAVAATEHVRSCCALRSVPPDGIAAHSRGAAAVCEDANLAGSVVPGASPPAETAPDYVLGVLLQRCRGQSPTWHSLPPCVLPAAVNFALSHEVVCTLRPTDVPWPAAQSPRPPEPPPRAAAQLFTAV